MRADLKSRMLAMWRTSGSDDGPLALYGLALVALCALSVFSVAMYGAYRLNVAVGLDTPQRQDTPPDQIFAIVSIVVAALLAVWSAVRLARVLPRRPVPVADRRGWDVGSSGVARVHTGEDVDRPLPERVSVHGRLRVATLGGWLCGAVLCAFIAVQARGELGWMAVAVAATGPLLVWVGLRSFKRGVVADSHGVTITNTLRVISIAWADLVTIDYSGVSSEAMDNMYYQLVFVRRGGRSTVAEVPGGGREPGQYLFELRETLLAMRDEHTSGVRQPPADPAP